MAQGVKVIRYLFLCNNFINTDVTVNKVLNQLLMAASLTLTHD